MSKRLSAIPPVNGAAGAKPTASDSARTGGAGGAGAQPKLSKAQQQAALAAQQQLQQAQEAAAKAEQLQAAAATVGKEEQYYFEGPSPRAESQIRESVGMSCNVTTSFVRFSH